MRSLLLYFAVSGLSIRPAHVTLSRPFIIQIKNYSKRAPQIYEDCQLQR